MSDLFSLRLAAAEAERQQQRRQLAADVVRFQQAQQVRAPRGWPSQGAGRRCGSERGAATPLRLRATRGGGHALHDPPRYALSLPQLVNAPAPRASQTKEQRREWDLSNPQAVRLAQPARVGDDDERCGPASIQRFDGEDLTAAQRKKLQMAQQVAWCTEQVRRVLACRRPPCTTSPRPTSHERRPPAEMPRVVRNAGSALARVQGEGGGAGARTRGGGSIRRAGGRQRRARGVRGGDGGTGSVEPGCHGGLCERGARAGSPRPRGGAGGRRRGALSPAQPG